MTALQDQIIQLRKQGLRYSEITEIVGCNRDYVRKVCYLNELRNDDVGLDDQHPHKGKAFIDWDKRIDERTNNRFSFVGQQLLESGESRLIIQCRKCGEIKNVSSISLRHVNVRCVVCFNNEKLKKDRERKKNNSRVRIFKQMSMNFCECGRLLPFGVKLCEECKRIKARQRERTKDHRRRTRERQGFDRTITLEKLYERDHGVCYLCNKTCDWQDFQRINGNFIVGGSYPTVEHVKALCKGGTHSWDNVKLACFACNSKKGYR